VARPGAGLDPASIRACLAGPSTRQGGDAVLRQLAPSFLAVERGGGPSARNLGALVLAENGGGQSPLSANENNWFSISHVPGRQHQAGPGTGGRFARYESPQASLADFVDLISTAPRYQEAWALRNAPPEQFFGALAKAGYIVPEPGFPVDTWLQNTAQGAARFDRAAAGVQPAAAAPQGPPTAGEPGGPPLAPGPVLGGPRGAPGQAAQGGALDVNGITQQYAGQPYVFGGAGGRSDMRPGVATDCSGFVSSVWKNQYGLDLPAHTDAAYNALKTQGAPEVAQADARPGDVVFYMGAGRERSPTTWGSMRGLARSWTCRSRAVMASRSATLVTVGAS
jgi:cell wall-associated NlpC family hydrolase